MPTDVLLIGALSLIFTIVGTFLVIKERRYVTRLSKDILEVYFGRFSHGTVSTIAGYLKVNPNEIQIVIHFVAEHLECEPRDDGDDMWRRKPPATPSGPSPQQ